MDIIVCDFDMGGRWPFMIDWTELIDGSSTIEERFGECLEGVMGDFYVSRQSEFRIFMTAWLRADVHEIRMLQ